MKLLVALFRIRTFALLMVSVQLISCATSTATRKAPGLVLDTLKVASGNPMGSSQSDNKAQITVIGHLPVELSCLSLVSYLIAEVRGPFPSESIVSYAPFDRSGTSTIISEALPGKYLLVLIHTRGSKEIASIEFNATKGSDRSELYFSECD